MHLARPEARIRCAMPSMDTKARRGGQGYSLSTTLYERCLPHAVASTLKVACEAMKKMHAADFDKDSLGDEEERAVCGISERIETVALWVPPAQKWCLAVRE